MAPMSLVVLAIAGVTMFSACNLQHSMLYFPDPTPPSDATLNAGGLTYWPSRSHSRGLVGTNYGDRAAGTIVVFHGNAGNAANRNYYVHALGGLGYRVILAEYPRYGGRGGQLGEKAFVEDGRETLRLAHEQYGRPLFLVGESLGCGVAAALASDSAVSIDGIVLITPWDTLQAVAQEKFPLFPVRLLLTDRYDTVGNLKAFKGTVAVVGAERDDVIPIHHARTLYDSLRAASKKLWILRNVGHNDWLTAVGPSWWTDVMQFLTGNP